MFVYTAQLVHTNEGVLRQTFVGASVELNLTIVFLALQYVLDQKQHLRVVLMFLDCES